MGCDHYLLLMRKPTDKETNHASKRLPHQTNLMVIAEGEQGWESLQEIGTKAPGFSQNIDYDLIMSDNNVPADATIRVFACRPDYERFIWQKTVEDENGKETTKEWEVIVTDRDLDQEYTIYEYGERLYVHTRTIRQWRNNDTIRDLIRKHMTVENCEYHILDKDTIRELCEIDPETAMALESKQPEEIVVYHEWY